MCYNMHWRFLILEVCDQFFGFGDDPALQATGFLMNHLIALDVACWPGWSLFICLHQHVPNPAFEFTVLLGGLCCSVVLCLLHTETL